jgi:hypothetical protein
VRRSVSVGKLLCNVILYGALGQGGVWWCMWRCVKNCAMCVGVPRGGSWDEKIPVWSKSWSM